jgi:hypothetical protein
MGMNETNGGAHAVAVGIKTSTTQMMIDAAAPWADGDNRGPWTQKNVVKATVGFASEDDMPHRAPRYGGEPAARRLVDLEARPAEVIQPNSRRQDNYAGYGPILLFGIAAAIRAWDRSPAAAMPLLLAASGVAVPFAALLTASMLKSVLYFRFLIFCAPALCLFVAGGLAAIRTRSIAAVALAGLVAGSAWHTWFMVERAPRFEWRAPAAYILSHAQPGDALAVRYWQNLLELDYYFGRLQMPSGLIEDVFPDWGPDLFIDGKYPMDVEAQEFMGRQLIAQIDSTAARRKRLWFVLGSEGMGPSFDQWASLPIIEQHLYADYGSVQIQQVEGFWVFLCSNPRATLHPAH